MAIISWIKSTQGEWLDFERCYISEISTIGVYIIWHGGQTPWTVYVGQGDIKNRFSTHRVDRRIIAYRPKGLFVTWAWVCQNELDGIERFLADQLRPLVEDKHPDVRPLPVNLPWAA